MKRQFDEVDKESQALEEEVEKSRKIASVTTKVEVRHEDIRIPASHFDWNNMRAHPIERKGTYRTTTLEYIHSPELHQRAPMVNFHKLVCPFPPKIFTSDTGKMCTIGFALQPDDDVTQRYIDGYNDFMFNNSKLNRMSYFDKEFLRTDEAIRASIQSLVSPSYQGGSSHIDPITNEKGPKPGAVRYEDMLKFVIPLNKNDNTPTATFHLQSTGKVVAFDDLPAVFGKRKMYCDVLIQLYCQNFSNGTRGIKPQTLSVNILDLEPVPAARKVFECLPQKHLVFAYSNKDDEKASIYDKNNKLVELPDLPTKVAAVEGEQMPEFETGDNVSFSREQVDNFGTVKFH